MTFRRDKVGSLIEYNQKEFTDFINKREDKKKIISLEKRVDDLEKLVLEQKTILEEIRGISNK
jgi:hypothetical protein